MTNNQYKRKLAESDYENELWLNEEVDQLLVRSKKRKFENLDETEENFEEDDSDTSDEDLGEVGELLAVENRPEECFYLVEYTAEPKVVFQETKLSITQIPEYCWSIIYSFAGMEHYFINRIYKLNSTLRRNLYESELFWEGILAISWPDVKMFSMKWREYFFKKYIAFETHNRLNPQFITGNYPNCFVSLPIQRSFENECFIYNQIELTTYHFKNLNFKLNSNMNWVVNVFLKTSPKIVGLRISMKFPNLILYAYFNGEEFPIFDEDQVVLNGVQDLFHAMELDVEIHAPFDLEFDERFKKLKFGQLNESTYFIWFCNRILGDVPFPIEDILGLHDFSNHLSFEIDEKRNETIAKIYECKKEVGIEEFGVNLNKSCLKKD